LVLISGLLAKAMLASTWTTPAESSPGKVGGAEHGPAERGTEGAGALQGEVSHPATPRRSTASRPEWPPGVEPVSTRLRSSSYAATDESAPLTSFEPVTVFFSLAGEGALDAAGVDLASEAFPDTARELRGFQRRVLGELLAEEAHHVGVEFVGPARSAFPREQCG
jgi:hypothetical protein